MAPRTATAVPTPGIVDVDANRFTVAVVDARGRPAGALHAARVAPAWMECDFDLGELAAALGRADRPPAVFAVETASLAAPFKRRGWGTELYLAAARHAAARHDAAITAHVCAGGSTSAEAERVWWGRRFNAEVARSGMVAYWVGPRAARANPVAPIRPDEVALKEYGDAEGFVVWAEDTRGGEVGNLVAEEMGRYARHSKRYVVERCRADLVALARSLGMATEAPPRAYVVTSSGVEPGYRGTGLGLELYLAAARRAAEKHGAALVAEACMGGSTSREARRVWQSTRFNAAVVRAEMAAYWVGEGGAAARRNPGPARTAPPRWLATRDRLHRVFAGEPGQREALRDLVDLLPVARPLLFDAYSDRGVVWLTVGIEKRLPKARRRALMTELARRGYTTYRDPGVVAWYTRAPGGWPIADPGARANPAADPTALTKLAEAIGRDGRVPLPWAVEHAPTGDLGPAWDASDDPRALLAVAARAGAPVNDLGRAARAVLRVLAERGRLGSVADVVARTLDATAVAFMSGAGPGNDAARRAATGLTNNLASANKESFEFIRSKEATWALNASMALLAAAREPANETPALAAESAEYAMQAARHAKVPARALADAARAELTAPRVAQILPVAHTNPAARRRRP